MSKLELFSSPDGSDASKSFLRGLKNREKTDAAHSVETDSQKRRAEENIEFKRPNRP